jgi:DNA-binding MarR family transcriptional regulator
MSTPTPPTRTDFGILLGLAYQRFKTELELSLATHGYDDIRSAYGYVFRALADGSLKLGELARRLDITDQGMLKIVQEMEGRGYVVREPDPDDGRANRVALAKRGRAALATARRFHASFERQLGATLGTAETAKFRALLERLVSEGDAAQGVLRLP